MFELLHRSRAVLSSLGGELPSSNLITLDGDRSSRDQTWVRKLNTLFDRLPVGNVVDQLPVGEILRAPGLFARLPVSENLIASDHAHIGDMYNDMKRIIAERVSASSAKNIMRGYDPFTGLTKSIKIPASLRYEAQSEEKAQAVFEALAPIVFLSLDTDKTTKELRLAFTGSPEKYAGGCAIWRTPETRGDQDSPAIYQIDALYRKTTPWDFLPRKTISSRINAALGKHLFHGIYPSYRSEPESFYIFETDVPQFLRSPQRCKVKEILTEYNRA